MQHRRFIIFRNIALVKVKIVKAKRLLLNRSASLFAQGGVTDDGN